MQPLFTVHAGEWLVGNKIEHDFRSLRLWIPSKDTGVDLLVTDEKMKRSVSLQVKMSRDYSGTEAGDRLGRELVATGWTVLDPEKIKRSPADYWVFVLAPLEHGSKPHFLVVKPDVLLKNLVATFGPASRYHLYPWLLKSGLCLNGRGLKKSERDGVVDGTLKLGPRDLTDFHEAWEPLRALVGGHY